MKIKNWLAGGALLAIAALPGIAAPASAVLASNGEILIGSTATNGDIHVNGLAAEYAVSTDPVLNEGPPPTIKH